MQFLAYFAAVVIAVAGVLFGVEVATAPAPHKPAHVAGPTNKLSRYETARREEKTEGDRSRPLTPLYPASPGGKDVRVIAPPGKPAVEAKDGAPAEIGKAAQAAGPKIEPKAEAAPPQPVQPVQPPPPEQQIASAPPQQKPQAVKVDEQPKPAAAAAPPVLQAQNRCDVAACSRAYSSFRAADCTYQPYEGPRRACTAPPPSRSADRFAARAQVSSEGSSEASEVRRRRGERRSANAVIYRDDAAMDQDDDDDSVQRVDDGRRVIIIERGDRPWD